MKSAISTARIRFSEPLARPDIDRPRIASSWGIFLEADRFVVERTRVSSSGTVEGIPWANRLFRFTLEL